jgi:transposase-like protein
MSTQDPRGGNGLRKDAPPTEELEEYEGVSEVAREYDVGADCAARWLRERGLYQPDRSRAGASSPLAQKLIDADPDEVFD